MTFLEAALAILKREGKPLHFKKLTEIALRENLLTVVGRTPEVTMQQRLNDALKKDTSLPLTREKPGIFGLRYYPPPEVYAAPAVIPSAEPAAAPATQASAVEEKQDAPEAQPERKRRRHRGGRGRRRGGATAASETQMETQTESADGPAEAVSAPPSPVMPTEPGPERLSFSEAAAQVAAGRPKAPFAPVAPLPEPPREESAEELAALAEEFETPSGPLIVPTAGTEELVKGEDHRPVYEGRRDRHRRRAPGRERPNGAQHHPAAAPSEPAPTTLPPAAAAPVPAVPAPPTAANVGSAIDVLVEVLRGSDGRPMHFRQIVDVALKRKLLRGEPQELWRLVRAAAVAERRAREAAGLRPRIRSLGGGNFGLGDRRLDGELMQYERELGERTARLSEATRVALQRRLGRLSPPAFEAFGRLLLERMGLVRVELVKRGEGVAYHGGERLRGGHKLRVLIALRPGEGQIGRRAVGELRAGLKARQFDEGLLLSAGRGGSDVEAELAAGAGTIELYDGEGITQLASRLGVGIVKRAVVVDTIDMELLDELQE